MQLFKFRASISTYIILTIILSAIIAIFVHFPFQKDQITVLFSATTFIYGTFTAFSVANSRGRLQALKETLKVHDSQLLNIHLISKLFDKDTQKGIKQRIDAYLIAQIDYNLCDFKYSYPTFRDLAEFALLREPKGALESSAHSELFDVFSDMNKERKKIEVLVRERMYRFEWSLIIVLKVILLICLFALNDGSLVSIITTVLLATSLVTIAIILDELNNLSWKEQIWIWQPLEVLFSELGLHPYFPKEVIDERRAAPEDGTIIRVAEYPPTYPNISGKKVTTMKVKGDHVEGLTN